MLRRSISRLRPPSLSTAIALLALSIAITGTAYAAAPTLFSIADQTTPANTAKVSAGALSTSGTVSGTVSAIPAAPKTPFSFPSASFTDGGVTIQFGATNATVAFTGFRVANQSSVSTTLTIYQYGEPSASCSTSPASSRFLGQFSVLAGATVDEQRTTPQIVKPLTGSPYWCFVTFASGSGGSAFYTTYSGYVLSGTFSPATSGSPTNPPTNVDPATALRGETRAQAATR
jgi:hypothetical protein